MRHIAYGAFWVGVYLAVVVAPLLVLLPGQVPPGRGFWRELSVGLGFIGLAMMGLQFFITGRFKHVTAPYGIDVVYHFHRQISLIAFLLLLLHPLLMVAASPVTAVFLNPLAAPWWAILGLGSLLVYGVTIGTTLGRRSMGLSYEAWRVTHGLLAVAAVTLSMAHIEGVGYYVRAPLTRGLWFALFGSWMLALLWVRLVKPALALRRPYTVERVVAERGRAWTLVLRPEGHAGMVIQPGQFAWVRIGRSPFAVREHPFSFSSSAMDRSRLALTIKELGDFTARIGEVTPGTRAFVDGPYGTFTIDRHRAPGYVFIAGGIGITPIVSILRTMADRHDTRPLVLFYGSRTWDDVAFREELDALGRRLSLRVVHLLTHAPDGWEGEQGHLTADVMARHLPEARMEYGYFVCGPEPMQRAVRTALEALGLPLERVQSESFNFV